MPRRERPYEMIGDYGGGTQSTTPSSTVKAMGNRWVIAEQYAVSVGSITVFRPSKFLHAVSSADSKCYILAWSARKMKSNISPNMLRVVGQLLELGPEEGH